MKSALPRTDGTLLLTLISQLSLHEQLIKHNLLCICSSAPRSSESLLACRRRGSLTDTLLLSAEKQWLIFITPQIIQSSIKELKIKLDLHRLSGRWVADAREASSYSISSSFFFHPSPSTFLQIGWHPWIQKRQTCFLSRLPRRRLLRRCCRGYLDIHTVT